MGGYGTWLFGLLYPDLFAGGFPQSGALTQGAWTGEGPDDCRSGQCYIEANDGDASAQLTYRLIENARHFPVAIDHGTDDELVPVTGVQRMAVRLRELGYRYQMTTYLGYEHFSQAIVDEWADGAAYLARQQLPTNPRRVTYKVVPALVQALNTIQSDGVAFDFDPDGAWWVDGIEARDGDPSDPAVHALVDATALGLEGTKPTLLVPTGGAASPPVHSTPYVRHGQDWLLPTAEVVSNGFEVDLTNVASVALAADRMGLAFGREVTGTVTTDGASTLVLTGVSRKVTVKVDGQSVTGAYAGGAITLQLAAGTHALSITPKR